MEKNVSKEVKRIIICCIASCIIAVDIRTFVRTGGLFPGGANGLTLLIQSIFDRYLHITIPYTAINVLLNAVPVYIGFRFIGKKFTLYSCLVIFLTGFLTDCLAVLHHHLRHFADQYFRRSDQRFRYQPLSEM